MPNRHPYGVAVEVLPYLAGVRDEWNNVSDTWAESGTVWPNCAIDSQSDEPLSRDREEVVATGKVYGPYDMVVAPKDRVKFRGKTWEVVGEVWREQNPFSGNRPGCWFGVRRAEVG